MSVRGKQKLGLVLWAACAALGCVRAQADTAALQVAWGEWRHVARPLDLEIRGRIADLRQKLVDRQPVALTPDLRRRLSQWDDAFASLKVSTEILLRDVDPANPLEIQIGDEVLLKYFRILSLRLQAERVLTSAPLANWVWSWDSRRLTMPSNLVDAMPSLRATLSDRWNGGESRFLETRLASSPVAGASAEVTLSESYLDGLEWASAVDRISEPAFFEATRRLLTTHLRGLSDRIHLLRTRADAEVKLPQGTRSGTWRRDTLGAHVSAELTQLTLREFSFIDETYLMDLARLLADDYGLKELPPKLLPTLQTSLREAELKWVAGDIATRYRESMIAWENLSDKDQRHRATQWTSEAFANAHLRYFLDAIVSGAIQLSESGRVLLVKLVEHRRLTLAAKLEPSPSLRRLLENAPADAARAWVRREQAHLRETLRAKSAELRELDDKAKLDAKPVDFLAAARTLAPRLRAEGATSEVLGWLDAISSEAVGWAAARKIYMAQLAAKTDPGLIREGQRVSESAVLLYLSQHDFGQGVWAPPSLPAGDATIYRAKIARERRANLRMFVRAGQALRFFSAFSDDRVPRARDLFASKDLPEYREALKQGWLNSYPLLGIPLGADHQTLAYKLGAVPPGSSAEWETILAALGASETRIENALGALGRARGPEDIESLLTDSLFLALSLEYYPELGKTAVKTVERLKDPSVVDRIMERHVGGYLMAGFGSLLVAHGTAWVFKGTAPFINSVLETLAPQIRLYVWTATGLVAADTIHQAAELKRAGDSARWAEDIFYASPESSYFFEESDVRHLQSSYQFAKWLFAGRIVLDSVFLYVPVSREMWALHGMRREIGAFRTLGLKAGEWERLEPAFRSARARLSTVGGDANPKVRQVEEAYKFLRSRLLSGAGGEARKVLGEASEELGKILNGDAA